MTKNGLNDPKFEHNMYYDDFNQFQKNKIGKKWPLFEQNSAFFSILRADFFFAIFRQKFRHF